MARKSGAEEGKAQGTDASPKQATPSAETPRQNNVMPKTSG